MAEELKTIREQTDECREKIEALKAEKATAKTRAQRSSINKRIHTIEGMEKWYRTRAGYK